MFQLFQWCLVLIVAGSIFYYLFRIFPVTAAILLVAGYVISWRTFPFFPESDLNLYHSVGSFLFATVFLICFGNDIKRVGSRFKTTNEEYKRFLSGAKHMLGL